jgi:hypothetical protein
MLDMSRARLAIALLVVSSALAASFLPASEAASAGRGYSHRLTVVSGQLVDHWTLTDSAPCHATGGGTVTVNFRLVKTKLVKLVLDPYHAGNPPSVPGSWVVAIPGPFGGLRDIPAQPAAGTITFADSTTQNPPEPGNGDCEPTDKSGCGTFALPRVAKGAIEGYNRRFLKADLVAAQLTPRQGECRVGELTSFSERLTGGTPLRGELLLRMPSVSVVAHRRVLTVVGTSHKRTAFTECPGDATGCSDDVTRRVSVTFKKL